MVKFKAGDLIEQCLPVAYALDTNDAGQRCDFCFCTMERPRVCLDCKSVFYCSKDCMKDDKRLAHKFGECDLLKTCPRMATDTQQLVLRLYLKCKAKPKLLEDKRTLFDGRKRSLA
ncbi:N-lysine methyltransferase SMYD2-A [Halotydeus destructor]|nr:N-lysine methyltransferase SMYD2-A [Halotydeus destructor]